MVRPDYPAELSREAVHVNEFRSVELIWNAEIYAACRRETDQIVRTVT